MPLGNVYYYFKSKDELIGAVLASYQKEAAALTRAFERHRSPQARLKALVQNWSDMRETVARHGCPMGHSAPSSTRTRTAAIATQPR